MDTILIYDVRINSASLITSVFRKIQRFGLHLAVILLNHTAVEQTASFLFSPLFVQSLVSLLIVLIIDPLSLGRINDFGFSCLAMQKYLPLALLLIGKMFAA